jgi:hypothetical protein
MSKQARKGKPMPWFKCWFFQWDTDEVAALDLETTGFLHLLKLRMAERRSPLPEQFLPHVARGKRLNKRSIERMLKTLIGYGLIVRENGLIWNEDIAEDIDGFFDVSQKFDQSFAKVSPEQRQKTQRNQCDASTEIEGDKEGYGRPHKGGVQDIDGENSSYSSGPASANAGRPDIGEEEERFFAGDAPSFDGREDFAAGDPPTADEAHSFFAQAFEALCASGDDPSFASPDKTSDTDEHQSFADEDDEFADDDDCEGRIPYDDPSSDEGGTDLGDASSDSQAEPIAAVVEDRATFVTQKHHRWPDEFDPDAVYDEGGEPIRNDDADETDVDFEDDADEETHEGARL